ncbi:MAG: cation transporter [Bacilli bacterium]|nr:cation transporter [Bacilli bacterium]MBR3049745.1 cation transporter [Bacilli bacterium]
MKTERNIFIAFILNLGFSIFELFGGIFTNSVAIISDSVHDMGDAISIGLSYFLEKKSKKDPDNNYTYGYIRYSVLGGLITTLILMVGSILVIYGAITRIIHPVDINYSGMIIFAIFGVIINFMAAYFTSRGDSINQRSVNLHMLEDVLGWVVVLIGAIIMNFTDIKIIDPIMSICVSLFILFHALKNFKKVLDLFLEKTPKEVSIDNLKNNLLKIDGVEDIHHIHVWSIDGYNNYATLHVVSDSKDIKKDIRNKLKKLKISHVTIEVESKDEKCLDKNCDVKTESHHHHH